MENGEKEVLPRIPENFPGVTFVLDENLRVLEGSKGFEAVIGRSERDVEGTNFGEFVPEERRDQITAVVLSANPGEELSVEIPLIRGNGGISPLLVGIAAVEENGTTLFVCNGMDVSMLRDACIDLEKSYRDLEERYHRTLDELMEGCQIVGFDWKYIYINEVAARHGQRNRQDYIGQRMQDLFPGIEDTPVFSLLERCMNERVSRNINSDFEHPDGSHGRFELSAHPVPEGLFILSEETSEKHELLGRSLEMEQRLESVMRNLPGMTFRCAFTMDWRMESIGGECLDLTGYEPEELIGNSVKAFGDLIHPDDRESAWAEIRNALVERLPFSISFRILHRDGRERWFFVQGHGAYGPEGNAAAIEGYAGDVTTLRMAEKARRDTEERYRILVENLGDVLYEIDFSSMRILFISPSVQWALGLREQDVLGRRIGDFIHPDDLLFVIAALRSLPEKEQVSQEFRVESTSGEYRWFSAVSRLLRGYPEDTGRIVGTMTDITEKRSLEEQLRQAQKLESVGILAGGVAHDFNNYLAVVMMYSEFLMDKIPDDDISHTPIREILEATKRATGLTRQLLAFSRKQAYSPEILDLNDVVRRLEKMLRRLIGEHIDFEINLDEDIGTIKADPVQMEQVLMNLSVNARDAMPEGGRLTISTARGKLILHGDESQYAAEDQKIALTPDNAMDAVVLKVADTGIGMEESVKRQIFEPFFTTKGRFHGTGLGLSTVYGIIKQSDGSIEVHSEPGKGAEFVLTLPVAKGERKESDKKMLRRGNGEKILVVEDEQALRTLIRNGLESSGYAVTASGNPEDAFAMVSSGSQRPDLLLTDLIMPEMNGTILADKIRSILPDLAVLYMSGYAGDENLMKNIRKGAATVLEKPFDTVTLSLAVRKALDGDGGGAR